MDSEVRMPFVLLKALKAHQEEIGKDCINAQ